MKEIPIVQEFPNVILDSLLRLALKREMEFSIELALGKVPISKAPYRIAPTKL